MPFYFMIMGHLRDKLLILPLELVNVGKGSQFAKAICLRTTGNYAKQQPNQKSARRIQVAAEIMANIHSVVGKSHSKWQIFRRN
jgi:hypothetical protein